MVGEVSRFVLAVAVEVFGFESAAAMGVSGLCGGDGGF